MARKPTLFLMSFVSIACLSAQIGHAIPRDLEPEHTSQQTAHHEHGGSEEGSEREAFNTNGTQHTIANIVQTARDEKTHAASVLINDDPTGDTKRDGYSVFPSHGQLVSKALESLISKSANEGDAFDKKDHAALGEFYAERDFTPVWVEGNALNSQARTLINRLSRAQEDGLDASEYPTLMIAPGADPETIALAEFKLSEAIVKYARHAQAGRVLPSKVSKTIKLKPVYPDPAEVIAEVSASEDSATTLASYNPPQAGYRALRDELVRLLNEPEDAPKPEILIPTGKAMYRGYIGHRVILLRERLNVPALDDENPRKFGEALKAAIKTFQRDAGLIADGIIGPKTYAALNGKKTKASRIPDLIANMERWRWMARDLGDVHIMANIPSFDVTIRKDGRNVHQTRTIVGKNRHKTPVFSDKMEHVVVNPYWNVPYSIASKELLPRIKKNPGYVSSRNYEILRGGRVVNAHSINWTTSSFRQVRIRQKPGNNNALGAVKFLFPNKHAIYFHDTPSKNLFQRVTRAFSHGCVRIHNPFAFGDALMKHAKGWGSGELQSLRGPRERWIGLKGKEQIPVHLTYFTTVADDEGNISFKSDVYGHNARHKQLLGLI